MATPTTYSYNFTKISIDQFTAQIEASPIITALDHIVQTGSAVDILFKDALSSEDKATLDSLVANYVYANPITPPQNVVVTSSPAFASKSFGNKSLFKRVVGKQFTLTTGDNILLYSETFPWVKFMAIEIINGEAGDYCSLYVLDTATGTYSGYPNATLNQFGFNANIAAGFYQHRSEFDADVYFGLQIKIVYHSVSDKTVGINYVMNEVK